MGTFSVTPNGTPIITVTGAPAGTSLADNGALGASAVPHEIVLDMSTDDVTAPTQTPADMFAEVDAAAEAQAKSVATQSPQQDIFPALAPSILPGNTNSALIESLRVKRTPRRHHSHYEIYGPASIDVSAKSSRMLKVASALTRGLYQWRIVTHYGKTAEKVPADVVELKRMADEGSKAAAVKLRTLNIKFYKAKLTALADEFDKVVGKFNELEVAGFEAIDNLEAMNALANQADADIAAQERGKGTKPVVDPLKAYIHARDIRNAEKAVLAERRRKLQIEISTLLETFKLLVDRGNIAALDVLLGRTGNLMVIKLIAKLSQKTAFKEKIEKYIIDHEITVPAGSPAEMVSAHSFLAVKGNVASQKYLKELTFSSDKVFGRLPVENLLMLTQFGNETAFSWVKATAALTEKRIQEVKGKDEEEKEAKEANLRKRKQEAISGLIDLAEKKFPGSIDVLIALMPREPDIVAEARKLIFLSGGDVRLNPAYIAMTVILTKYNGGKQVLESEKEADVAKIVSQEMIYLAADMTKPEVLNDIHVMAETGNIYAVAILRVLVEKYPDREVYLNILISIMRSVPSAHMAVKEIAEGGSAKALRALDAAPVGSGLAITQVGDPEIAALQIRAMIDPTIVQNELYRRVLDRNKHALAALVELSNLDAINYGVTRSEAAHAIRMLALIMRENPVVDAYIILLKADLKEVSWLADYLKPKPEGMEELTARFLKDVPQLANFM